MKIKPFKIKDLYHIEVDAKIDSRGKFARIYCAKEFEHHYLNTKWVQINISVNSIAGTLRGLHFQTGNSAEVKLVRCIHGQAIDIALDLRKDSETYGEHVMVELDSERLNSIYIPPGFAHGFQTMSDKAVLQYFHSAFYEPKKEGGVNALDPDLSINWPLPINKLSDRDANLPPFKKVIPL